MFMDFEKLGQKLKYLIMMELGDRYDLKNFYTEFEPNSKGKLSVYEIDLKFDYMGPIDADWEDFVSDLNTAFVPIKEAISKFPVNEKGELDLSFENFIVVGPFIWDLIYGYDETHIIHCSYRVTVLDKNE